MRQSFSVCLALSLLALIPSLMSARTAIAQASKFVCAQNQGLPTTLALTERGSVPVIRWESSYFSGSGYDPQTRCEQVSQRFELYYRTQKLKYLTTGVMNRLPVICVTDSDQGECQGLLFTLKPDSNPDETLKRLLNVRRYSMPPLNESSVSRPSRVYINLDEFLRTAPVETDQSQANPWNW